MVCLLISSLSSNVKDISWLNEWMKHSNRKSNDDDGQSFDSRKNKTKQETFFTKKNN